MHSNSNLDTTNASLAISQHTIATTQHRMICATSGVSYTVMDSSGIEGYKISQPVSPMMLPHTLHKLIEQPTVAIEYKVGAALAAIRYAGLSAQDTQISIEDIEKLNYLLASSLEPEDCQRLIAAIDRAQLLRTHNQYLNEITKFNLLSLMEHKPAQVRGLFLGWIAIINNKHDAETAHYIRSTYEQRQRSAANKPIATKSAPRQKIMTIDRASLVLAKSCMERAELYPDLNRPNIQKASRQIGMVHPKVQEKMLIIYEAAYEIMQQRGELKLASPLKQALIYIIDYLRGEALPTPEFNLDWNTDTDSSIDKEIS